MRSGFCESAEEYLTAKIENGDFIECACEILSSLICCNNCSVSSNGGTAAKNNCKFKGGRSIESTSRVVPVAYRCSSSKLEV
jgi:hypothetical protein